MLGYKTNEEWGELNVELSGKHRWVYIFKLRVEKLHD